jgi:hypothetical protein
MVGNAGRACAWWWPLPLCRRRAVPGRASSMHAVPTTTSLAAHCSFIPWRRLLGLRPIGPVGGAAAAWRCRRRRTSLARTPRGGSGSCLASSWLPHNTSPLAASWERRTKSLRARPNCSGAASGAFRTPSTALAAPGPAPPTPPPRCAHWAAVLQGHHRGSVVTASRRLASIGDHALPPYVVSDLHSIVVAFKALRCLLISPPPC